MGKFTELFFSLYSHGMVRVAACIPEVFPAQPEKNAERIIAFSQRVYEKGAVVAVFPELSLCGYSNEDLFHQNTLLKAAEDSFRKVLEFSKEIETLLIVGCPISVLGALYNCGLAIFKGKILAAFPKTFLPNYREFYEKRQFTSGYQSGLEEIHFAGMTIPFGSNILLEARGIKNLIVHSEICEDLWSPIPPSTFAALAGATLLTNLSASNITIGKADYRRQLCSSHSAATLSAYIYAGAGEGESTNDLAWDGHGAIFENGIQLSEDIRFSFEEQLIFADIDLERLVNDRMKITTFSDTKKLHLERVREFRRISFDLNPPKAVIQLEREVHRFPYVPSVGSDLEDRCSEAHKIQISGLSKRLKSSNIPNLVLGISGGLDSTHALIIAAGVMDRLGLPRHNIFGVTMPGFATSPRTKKNAVDLMEALGVTSLEIDIKPSCLQMLKDINHPYSEGKMLYDVTFENVQAGERTSHLFRLANLNNAMVIGTGDLSELALGWCTYGVGDHMSHYNVNASVPKTLIQHLIRWVVSRNIFLGKVNMILQSILETEISPELVPVEANSKDDQPAQKTEQIIGPYELHDFFIYYTTRFGFTPSKVAFLAFQAWKNKTLGRWPNNFPDEKMHEYKIGEIKKWLGKFLFRFFQISQFKRTCVPNGPKVGSGGSLSPRGDWRAPSDISAQIWIEELNRSVPEE
ncbi:MAG: NAD(+) synthase [Candidatus Riflebacteria bacterium]|nr:NAD(+) synthase [Candidatus Riflebacteria bacterium]